MKQDDVEDLKDVLFEIFELEQKIKSLEQELDKSVEDLRNIVDLYEKNQLRIYSTNTLGCPSRDESYTRVNGIPDDAQFRSNLKELGTSRNRLIELKRKIETVS